MTSGRGMSRGGIILTAAKDLTKYHHNYLKGGVPQARLAVFMSFNTQVEAFDPDGGATYRAS